MIMLKRRNCHHVHRLVHGSDGIWERQDGLGYRLREGSDELDWIFVPQELGSCYIVVSSNHRSAGNQHPTKPRWGAFVQGGLHIEM